MQLRSLTPLAVAGVFVLCASVDAREKRREIRDVSGHVIEILGPAGRPRDIAGGRQTRPVPPGGQAAQRAVAAECKPAGEGAVPREHQGEGFRVDACGQVRNEAGEIERRERRQPEGLPQVTIDRMTTYISYGSFTPGGMIILMGSADDYQLSDATQWSSGAGSYWNHGSQVIGVETSGTTIRYTLSPPSAGLMYQQTDYDSGDHSAQGSLAPAGTLVLEAEAGSTTAVLRGNALLVSNDPTWYGEPRFNYYSALPGSVVPFEVTFTRQGSGWTPAAFTQPFDYTAAGWVDFAHPVSVPRAVGLRLTGPSRVPDDFTTSLVAYAQYEGGVERRVTSSAGWSVTPAWLASIAGGVLTTNHLATGEEMLTVHASYAWGPDTVTAEKQVLCRADDPAEKPDTWPMFQANSRHTGYLPITLTPSTFALRWQKDVGGTYPLNPVAAGEGKVFVTLLTYFNDVPSLFALDALDGDTLWSKQFGDIFSVNPPSLAYGQVYVQTGNHADDTWLRAFDAVTGEPDFTAPHEAQWERYFAPTVFEGKVYINGGYYGGMYGFDAYSGSQMWFAELEQYDQWTPAVEGARAYAYVGEYAPGLYGRDRMTGAPAMFAPDPAFEWDGWSMNLAPVIGAHDDVIAIHDGRLLSFNTVQNTIRWTVASQFAGQPSVARDRIYALDGGRLVVLDEVTHATLWSWQAPDGPLAGPMIVTDTHLLVSTAQSVHAVDLLTQQSVWSYAAAGQLAMADDTLYIAGADGRLTAISAPRVVPSELVSLEVTGLAQVGESSNASYRARAHYADGAVADRTLASQWSVQPGAFASFTGAGELHTEELIRPYEDVTVKAVYTEGAHTVEGTLGVRIVAAVTGEDLVRRNVTQAITLKQHAMSDLTAALARERASQDVLASLPPSPWVDRAIPLLADSVCLEMGARTSTAWSIQELLQLLQPALSGAPAPGLGRCTPPPAPPPLR